MVMCMSVVLERVYLFASSELRPRVIKCDSWMNSSLEDDMKSTMNLLKFRLTHELRSTLKKVEIVCLTENAKYFKLLLILSCCSFYHKNIFLICVQSFKQRIIQISINCSFGKKENQLHLFRKTDVPIV